MEIPQVALRLSGEQARNYDSDDVASETTIYAYDNEHPRFKGRSLLEQIIHRIETSQNRVIILDLGSRNGEAITGGERAEGLVQILDKLNIPRSKYNVLCFNGGDKNDIERDQRWGSKVRTEGFIFGSGDMLQDLEPFIYQETNGVGVDICFSSRTLYHSPFDISCLQIVNNILKKPDENSPGGIASLIDALQQDYIGRVILDPYCEGEPFKRVPARFIPEILKNVCGWDIEYKNISSEENLLFNDILSGNGILYNFAWQKTESMLDVPVRLVQVVNEYLPIFLDRDDWKPCVRAIYVLGNDAFNYLYKYYSDSYSSIFFEVVRRSVNINPQLDPVIDAHWTDPEFAQQLISLHNSEINKKKITKRQKDRLLKQRNLLSIYI